MDDMLISLITENSKSQDTIDKKPKIELLFGGNKLWNSDQWKDSDDRVRGGKSQSYLTISDDKKSAKFHGNLDIKTLGGAGFASQTTKDRDVGPWDLDGFDGLVVGIGESDERIYTIIIKDEILPKRPDGRESSSLSYEFSLKLVNRGDEKKDRKQDIQDNLLPSRIVLPEVLSKDKNVPIIIFVPWKSFIPFYRGKEKPDAKGLDLKGIKRFSVMCRSMFGKQEGDFEVELKFIGAIKGISKVEKVELERLEVGYTENGTVYYEVLKDLAIGEEEKEDEKEWEVIDDIKNLSIVENGGTEQ